jgi:hypothetical protein
MTLLESLLNVIQAIGSDIKSLNNMTINNFPERLQVANVSGTFNLDLSLYESFRITMTGPTTFTISNAPLSKRVKLVLSGDFTPNFSQLPNVIVRGIYNGSEERTVIGISVTNNEYDVFIPTNIPNIHGLPVLIPLHF